MNEKLNRDEIHLDEVINSLPKHEILVPEELEDRIKQRIDTLKSQKHYLRNTIAACMAVCILFAGGVRFSPVFASYAGEIPGLKTVVEWLKGDKGVKNAHRHGYKSLPAVTVEENGYILTLDHIYFDEDRLRLAAILGGPKIEQLEAIPQQMTVSMDENGNLTEEVPGVVRPYINISFVDFEDTAGSQWSSGSNENEKYVSIGAEKTFKPGEVRGFLDKAPEYLSIKVWVSEYMKSGDIKAVHDFGIIKVPYNLQEIQLSKIYEPNKTIALEHTILTIKSLTVSPTRMRLDVTADMDNGYIFTEFENPCLMDDKGRVYKPEGLISTHWTSNERSLFFVPSIYFDKLPEKLHFCFDGIRIASEEGKRFTIKLNEKYPKILRYMGEEIIIEKVWWKRSQSGNLGVSVLLPDPDILKIQSFNILNIEGYDNWKSWSINEKTKESGGKQRAEFNFKVPEQDSYEAEFEFPGYLIKTNTACELEMDN